MKLPKHVGMWRTGKQIQAATYNYKYSTNKSVESEIFEIWHDK